MESEESMMERIDKKVARECIKYRRGKNAEIPIEKGKDDSQKQNGRLNMS